MFEENDSNDILNRLSIKTLSTIKNENEENKSKTIEQEKTQKYIKIFKQENDSKTLNLVPNNFNLKIMNPIATYHSKKIPVKNRNHSVKNSRSKSNNNSNQEMNLFKKGGTINFKKLIREKLDEKYTISNINFEFYPNKKKENFIICDTENLNNKINKRNNNIFQENFSDIHFKKEEGNNIYEIIDDQINEFNNLKIENKENINSNTINYNFNNNELETDYSQTQSNSKQNSHKSKIRIGKRNIKKIILNETESSLSPNIIERKTNYYQNNNNNYSSYFRKMNFKSNIKLPDFSWIYNKGNSYCKKKNHKKIIVKKNKNCLYKESEIKNNNFKFVDYNELYKIHKENDLNQINDKNSNKYFQQSEIYKKLTHSKDKNKLK